MWLFTVSSEMHRSSAISALERPSDQAEHVAFAGGHLGHGVGSMVAGNTAIRGQHPGRDRRIEIAVALGDRAHCRR